MNPRMIDNKTTRSCFLRREKDQNPCTALRTRKYCRSQVGAFDTAWQSSELVIVGAGGELTVRFDHPVENDPPNPYGIDFAKEQRSFR